MIQRTLIIMKPTAVKRAITGEIVARFERTGLIVVGSKVMKPTRDQFFAHYETIGTMVTRYGDAIFSQTVDMMMAGPVIAYVLEGDCAVENVRKLVGPTEPKSALPGTIRGDYAHVSRDFANSQNKGIDNLIHASGNAEEAEKEIALWFTADELVSY